MLIKMKESKGFTLVELMIVVAIIGILAAVAVPFYQRYVAKSRLTSLVFPGLHSIETNISTYFSAKGTWPTLSVVNDLDSFDQDADTTCFDYSGLDAPSSNSFKFGITIDSSDAKCNGLKRLDGMSLTLKAQDTDGKLSWTFEGQLADELGL
ncbi:type IV pilus assembly protein PilA [Desulfacinum hydrothermale DSM 13146]|uniref:Type IV pilus assembly protein PilA n=1 Tax=Desulfacinum hydrothermale DSM 13146 TaxID=1121390 RepID=A0A1W1X6H4_9BACT|nr:pilin [Desulfacinum hydrothermale]SMC19535.1 type IV pilus assembly protein PilA [Desulfacinum hydrothermale DSM 13146]